MYFTRSTLIQKLQKSDNGRILLLIIQKIKSFVLYIWKFVRSHKNMMTIMIPIAATSVIALLYFIGATIRLHYSFAQDDSKFYQTNAYDTSSVQWFADAYPTIQDAVVALTDVTQTVDRYYAYLNSLQAPYTTMLQHILLPSLFIRKDPYTNELDTSIVGKKFIEENPFTDTALIQYWSDFFRNVGDGTDYIVIKDMKLWDMEEWVEQFTIPVTVSFVAPTKRAFLLLVDKLSLTSQEATISLINQFFYHVRSAIKQDQSVVEKAWEDIDTYIGQYIYQRVFDDGPNNMVTTGVLLQAVQDTAQCQLLNTQTCLYTFRNTYRSIPQLAYGIGLDINTQSIQALKRFIKELPPLITIADFNFQKTPVRAWTPPQYEWSVIIHMHGRSVKNDDVDQVAFTLWNQCLGNNIFLSPQSALETVDAYLRRVSDSQIAQQQSTQLLQLRRIVAENQTQFETLSNYNKVIKLFELDKMLTDAGICK